MMKIKKYLNKKTAVLSGTLLAVLLFIIGKNIYDYAAPPSGPKDCDYIYPQTSDPSKPTTISITNPVPDLNLEQTGGVMNDASCLNKTPIYGVVKATSIDDIKKALQFARDNKIKVTPAGQHHSMGGQSFSRNGLVLDMKSYNQIKLDKEHKTVNVQTGATWKQLQEVLDKEGLSVVAMQSINIFSVGGTLSVNAHGIAHDPGQVAPTVRSMRIMDSSGQIKTASLTQNSELFKSALGGYGLMGVILDVDLDVTENEVYAYKTTMMDYKDFPAFYEKNIADNKKLGLFYGRISLSPTSYLTETAIHTYEKMDNPPPPPQLNTTEHDWLQRLVINFSKTGAIGRWVRWNLEKVGDSKFLHQCITRNDAMSQPDVICDVSRNQEMYDAMGYLKNKLPDTDILQEYFIPPENMTKFIDSLRDIVKKNKANLLNVTIRIVHKDNITALPYAKGDRFAFVLYFNQKFNDKESQILQKTTTDLIDAATNVGGAYYLPYQLFYTSAQLRKAYPEVDKFFATKKKYDPTELFSNTWYEKYSIQ